MKQAGTLPSVVTTSCSILGAIRMSHGMLTMKSQTGCAVSRLSVLGGLYCGCEGPHLYVCRQCCRSCIMRVLRGTDRSLCLRVAQSMSTAKGAAACIAWLTGTSHALDEWIMCRQHLAANRLFVAAQPD
jgi:hypothetical protein